MAGWRCGSACQWPNLGPRAQSPEPRSFQSPGAQSPGPESGGQMIGITGYDPVISSLLSALTSPLYQQPPYRPKPPLFHPPLLSYLCGGGMTCYY